MMPGRSFKQEQIPDVRRGVRNLLFFAAPTLLAIILSSLRGRNILAVARTVDWRCVGAMTVLAAFKWIVDGFRLCLVVRRSGHDISLWKSIVILVASMFGANVTPFYAGGLATQVYFLTDASFPLGKAGAIGATYGILNLAANLILSVIVLLAPHSAIDGTRRLAVLGLAGAMSVCAVFLFLAARYPDRAEKLLRGLLHSGTRVADHLSRIVWDFSKGITSLMSGRYITFAGLVAVSLVSQVLSLLFTPLAFQALRIARVSLAAIMLTQAGVQFSCSVGATPGGIGIVEAIFALFFAPLAGSETAAVTLLWRFETFYLPTLAGAAAFMSLLRCRRPGQNER